jgi:GTP-binding protein
MAKEDAASLERGRLLFAGPCEFQRGISSLEDAPKVKYPETAFAGRSNVGKSSLINALTNRKTLARVSNTPGRTREINFFSLDKKLMLADLPGYGFAKVAKTDAERWQTLMFGYLSTRPNLRRVILLIDSRRGIMENDEEAMALLDRAAISYQIVLTKADALKKDELASRLEETAARAARHGAAHPEILITSSETGAGLPELRAALAALVKS